MRHARLRGTGLLALAASLLTAQPALAERCDISHYLGLSYGDRFQEEVRRSGGLTGVGVPLRACEIRTLSAGRPEYTEGDRYNTATYVTIELDRDSAGNPLCIWSVRVQFDVNFTDADNQVWDRHMGTETYVGIAAPDDLAQAIGQARQRWADTYSRDLAEIRRRNDC